MSTFTPDDKTIKIMKNFATINDSILIKPDKLEVMSNSKSVIAKYPYPKQFNFEPFGIITAAEFLNIIGGLSKPEVEVHDTFIYIKGSNDDTVKYGTYSKDKVPAVPSIDSKIANTDWNLEFSLPADKMSLIQKIAQILKSKYMHFESDNKAIRIIIGDTIQSSDNNYEIVITDGIKTNKLDKPYKISMVDFKVLEGEYEVKISKKLTQWENLNGATYYIAPAA